MSEADPFKIHISLLDLAKATGSWAVELFRLHPLATHGNHFVHPLDEPTDWPDPTLEHALGRAVKYGTLPIEEAYGQMAGDSALHLPPRVPFS